MAEVTVRDFAEADVADKVRWVNDPANNRFLHYDLPLTEEGTLRWFRRKDGPDRRWDAVVELDGRPVGLAGLLGIDGRAGKAEFYVMLGEASARGRGVARRGSELVLEGAFGRYGLRKVYLYTETGNLAAQRLFERLGFVREGELEADLVRGGTPVDRYAYGLTRGRWEALRAGAVPPARAGGRDTPVVCLGEVGGNRLFVKRDDLVPFSFGGNKARKAELFFAEVDAGGHDCVVTYGSGHSNHCRVVAGMAAGRGIPCHVVSPEEASGPTLNSALVGLLGAEVEVVPVSGVRDALEARVAALRAEGRNPYLIQGGGHGNLGTEAYRRCAAEIGRWERGAGVRLGYVFHASGTGTTQAGLVCGKVLDRSFSARVVGVSIARRNPRGGDVVRGSVAEYLASVGRPDLAGAAFPEVEFDDRWVGGGYAGRDPAVDETILGAWRRWGLPLDSTYTGKAFHGMLEYLRDGGIRGADVLFVHTGGAPLFFDDVATLSGRGRE